MPKNDMPTQNNWIIAEARLKLPANPIKTQLAAARLSAKYRGELPFKIRNVSNVYVNTYKAKPSTPIPSSRAGVIVRNVIGYTPWVNENTWMIKILSLNVNRLTAQSYVANSGIPYLSYFTLGSIAPYRRSGMRPVDRTYQQKNDALRW